MKDIIADEPKNEQAASSAVETIVMAFKSEIVKTATGLSVGFVIGGFFIMIFGDFPFIQVYSQVVGAYTVAFFYELMP